ncbi:MAG: hypothetical protein Q7K11_01700 [Candidatus Berkelbacteria bacterium]|nr:hypothetical protein [Candidatus Berkelbacteria bacterium]
MSIKSVRLILGLAIIVALIAVIYTKGFSRPASLIPEKQVSSLGEPIAPENIENNLNKTSAQIQTEIDRVDSDLKDIEKIGTEEELNNF